MQDGIEAHWPDGRILWNALTWKNNICLLLMNPFIRKSCFLDSRCDAGDPGGLRSWILYSDAAWWDMFGVSDKQTQTRRMGEREILLDPICQQKQSPNDYLSARRGTYVFDVHYTQNWKMTTVHTSSSHQVFSNTEAMHYCHVAPGYNICILTLTLSYLRPRLASATSLVAVYFRVCADVHL